MASKAGFSLKNSRILSGRKENVVLRTHEIARKFKEKRPRGFFHGLTTAMLSVGWNRVMLSHAQNIC